MKKIILFTIILTLATANSSIASNILPNYLTNIPVDVVGSEIITVENNRTFASDTGFYTRTGTTVISGGVLNIQGNATQGAYKLFLLTIGKVYYSTFDVPRIGNGSLSYGIGLTSTAFTTTGSKVNTSACSGNAHLTLYAASSSTNLDVDNLSIKPVSYAINTKSLYSGSWLQNITGATISGDTAGVLSIISGPGANGKAYQIANTGSVDVVVTLTPSEALVVGRHYRPSVIAKRTVGTGTPTYKLTGGTAVSITSSAFTLLAAPAVATNTTDKPTFTVPAGCTIQFYLPKLIPILSVGGNFRDFNFSFQY